MSVELVKIEKKLGEFRLRDFNLRVERGETLGVVGGSGSGKTTVFKILLRLLRPDRGSYFLDGRDAMALSRRAFSRRVQGVFQNASRALDPRKTVDFLLREPYLIHRDLEPRVEELLREVSLPPEILRSYPPQLSGGQQQRVVLARALALEPDYLVADEPTSALDPTVQVQILKLLKKIQARRNMGLVFISHDINQVLYMSQGLLVMLSGLIMESGGVEEVLKKPSPYTLHLLNPRPSREREGGACPFYGLCPLAGPKCQKEIPPLRSLGEGHLVRCHYM